VGELAALTLSDAAAGDAAFARALTVATASCEGGAEEGAASRGGGWVATALREAVHGATNLAKADAQRKKTQNQAANLLRAMGGQPETREERGAAMSAFLKGGLL
jgi:hypothetical protein